MQPGYDDTRLGGRTRRSHRAWTASATSTRCLEVRWWRGPTWIFLSTWNDYLEQTQILPGDESGSTALEPYSPNWTNVFHRPC